MDRWTKLTLGAILSLALGGQASGVGPFFENERKPGDHMPGPTPEILAPREAPSVRPPEVTRLVKGKLLYTDEYLYVVREESGDAEVSLKITPDTRIGRTPRVGDRIEAEVRSNGDAWSVKPIE